MKNAVMNVISNLIIGLIVIIVISLILAGPALMKNDFFRTSVDSGKEVFEITEGNRTPFYDPGKELDVTLATDKLYSHCYLKDNRQDCVFHTDENGCVSVLKRQLTLKECRLLLPANRRIIIVPINWGEEDIEPIAHKILNYYNGNKNLYRKEETPNCQISQLTPQQTTAISQVHKLFQGCVGKLKKDEKAIGISYNDLIPSVKRNYAANYWIIKKSEVDTLINNKLLK